MATSLLPSGTVPGPSHSQPVPRLAGRDSVINLTMWTVTSDTVVFEGGAQWLAVGSANPIHACLAHASPKQSSFTQTSHGMGKRAIPKGLKATLGQQDQCTDSGDPRLGRKMARYSQLIGNEGQEWVHCPPCLVGGCSQEQASSPASISPKALSPPLHSCC